MKKNSERVPSRRPAKTARNQKVVTKSATNVLKALVANENLMKKLQKHRERFERDFANGATGIAISIGLLRLVCQLVFSYFGQNILTTFL